MYLATALKTDTRKIISRTAIVLPLLMFLVWILLPTVDKVPRTALESVLRSNLQAVRVAISEYGKAKVEYPQSLQSLVEEGYLRRIPIDHITHRFDSWDLVRNGQGRIISVSSGSKDRALDGSLYKLW